MREGGRYRETTKQFVRRRDYPLGKRACCRRRGTKGGGKQRSGKRGGTGRVIGVRAKSGNNDALEGGAIPPDWRGKGHWGVPCQTKGTDEGGSPLGHRPPSILLRETRKTTDLVARGRRSAGSSFGSCHERIKKGHARKEEVGAEVYKGKCILPGKEDTTPRPGKMGAFCCMGRKGWEQGIIEEGITRLLRSSRQSRDERERFQSSQAKSDVRLDPPGDLAGEKRMSSASKGF